MQCPSCHSRSLKPIKLQPGLAARQCLNCKGILLDLLAYRNWAENHYRPDDQPAYEAELVEDTSKALICPKCSKIMLKFRISGDTSNRVDVCQYCDEAWLDHGEWELLGALKIQNRLNAVFTEPWQKNIREETTQKAQEQRFREQLGDSEYTKLKTFAEWISDHPNKGDIIRYIMKNH